jgi:hypothetical protein
MTRDEARRLSRLLFEGVSTTVDLEALARHPEVYAEVVSTKTTWTIQIDKAYKNGTRES